MNRRYSYQPSSRRGMVLFEVAMAMAVFIIVAFSLITVLYGSMEAAKTRNEIDAAMRGMQNQLALLHANRVTPQEHDLPDDQSGILYHLKIEPEFLKDQKNQPLPNLYRVTISAKWKSGNVAEDRSVSELVYQP